MMPLTKRQKAIYEWIVSYHQKNGNNPTIREIGVHFGIRSPNGVVANLLAMEQKGWVSRSGRTGSRSWGPLVHCRWWCSPPVDGLYVCDTDAGMQLHRLKKTDVSVVAASRFFGPIEEEA